VESGRRGLLLFDIDGTLLRSRGQGLRAMHAAFQEVFALPPRAARIQPHGKTDPMLFEEMALAYGLAGSALNGSLARLQARYVSLLQEQLAREADIEIKPGVPQLLQALGAQAGVDLALVTGNMEPVAWAKLQAVDLARHFDAGAFGSDARERSTLVALAIERMGRIRHTRYAPPRIWVIGDTPADVASGRAHGTHTLAVATGIHDRETLRATGADVVLDDFEDVEATVDILCGRR